MDLFFNMTSIEVGTYFQLAPLSFYTYLKLKWRTFMSQFLLLFFLISSIEMAAFQLLFEFSD